ncbi:Kelch repeat-containing protein [Colletotrichum orbiculare MAFF 240422]|uniref:Kelch repeat-containing protein n=1 Tax=Colletotrichum orbiculare (strain 104-T / ATCC 96160 / CBS 514.97 / LARS 414 / MAFF 240422) TaxID=1213857 RepID=N4VM18_COLOR|nr:Kelch repeat-containing protein [Colletotrichum orbiculare MAFF 240422]
MRSSARVLVSCLVASAQCWNLFGEAKLKRREDSPAPSDFLRRAFASAIVVGDYLYIDGGEVSQLFNGRNSSASLPSWPVNSTLSVHLGESWTNSTVTFRSTPKTGAPKLNKQALWRDPAATAFYAWGGITSYFAQPPANELWRFEVDGAGGGAWARAATPRNNLVALAQLVRATDGAFAQSKDVGYYFGGFASEQTDTSVSGPDSYLAVPGLVAYNMTSGDLKNVSSTGFGGWGNLVGGAAQFVPFGTDGLLVFMGGGQGPIATKWGGWKDVDFNEVRLYNPQTDKWHTQQTTGSRPTRREKFCTVGVPGPNNTYEIFLYGGMNSQTSTTSDEVYVLSLPGFVFFKANGPSTKRADQACVVVGQRQMLSVGGTDGFLGYPNSLTDPDPWASGLGVFDLTQMKWVDGYNAHAEAYESPEVVRQWYNQGGLESVVWASEEVRMLFATSAAANSTSEPTATGHTGEKVTSSQESSPEAQETNSSQPPVGAVIGGVAGGIIGLALVIALVWILVWRRRRRYAAAPQLSNELISPAQPVTEYWAPKGSATVTTVRHEVHSDLYNPSELPGDYGVAEVNAPHGRQEIGRTDS